MHIILTKNMHMKVFFICLFLFSKFIMSKYNIYFEKKMLMRVMRQEQKKMQKSEENRKITRSQQGMSIFPLFFSYFFLFFFVLFASSHYSRGQGNFFGCCRVITTKKGARIKDMAKMASFWSVFYLISFKMMSFWLVLFKMKGAKTASFWSLFF